MPHHHCNSRILKAGFLFSSLILILVFSLWTPVQGQEVDYPLTYTDVLGYEVTITAQPQTIISLAPSVTEILFAIGAGPQVVGRTDYDNYPLEVEAIPSVGGFSGQTISIETIVELEPDLVIGGSVYQADLVPILESAGITIIVVEPASVDDVLQTIQALGEITGNVEGATNVINDVQDRMAVVTEAIDTIPVDERVTVFYEVWHEPLMTTTAETFIGELITLAGGVNIFNDLEGTYPTISAEQIIDSDPAVILGPSNHADQLTVEMIASRDGWENLSAVTEEQVFIVDGDIISRSGPRIIDALETIATQLYPDLFTKYPIIYTDVLGYEVTITEQPQTIISLAPSVTEILFAIGAGPQVVGRTDYDNYPLEVEAIPSVGGFSGQTISIETIVELEPDLVIGGSVYQADLVPILERAGITIIVVEPASVDDVLQTIQALGEITGNVEGATNVINDVQDRMAVVTEAIDTIPVDERVTVFYEVWHEPLMTTTAETFIGELITLAGGVNIFNDLEGTYPTISAEQIIDSDPAVILGPSNHADQLTVEMIASRDGWENLSAVTEEQVFIVDGDIISRSGPRIIDALEAIATQLYPDLFTKYPIIYTDVLGYEVTITEQPQTIISLAPSVTEILFAIGAGPQVVGRTDYDNYPLEVEAIPSVGGFSGQTISIETIVELEPDLVIGGSVYQADLVPILESVGITIIVVEPASVDDVLQTIQALGEITGNVEGAINVVNDIQDRMAVVAEAVDAIPADERVTVFYEVWHEPLMTTTAETFIGELITLAGGVNIFNDLEGTYPTISAEQIIDSDPAVILGPSNHADQLTVEMIASRDGWENLSAVTEERVTIVDGDIISRSGPRIIDALEAIATQLYPDLFEGTE